MNSFPAESLLTLVIFSSSIMVKTFTQEAIIDSLSHKMADRNQTTHRP